MTRPQVGQPYLIFSPSRITHLGLFQKMTLVEKIGIFHLTAFREVTWPSNFKSKPPINKGELSSTN